MTKISVIIPVYNAQNYLKRCLDSVYNQTLKDIEIICIDDCSTDNSLNILNGYAKNDERIKVIACKTNGGESVARNIGIDNATGEYIAFLDNDDFIDLNFYEKLYSKAIETNSDIVKGEVCIYDYNGNKSYGSLNQEIRQNNSKLFFAYNWWTAIYKTKLVKDNNIRLLEGYPLGADVLFLNEAILKCNKLELVDDVFYHYIRREDSGDSKVLSLKKIKSVMDIHEKIVDNINENIGQLDKLGVLFLYNWCVLCGLNYARRRKTLESLEYCICKVYDIYKKCLYKNELIENLNKTHKLESYYLNNKTKEDLINLYIKNDTFQKRFIANLRFNMLINKVENV